MKYWKKTVKHIKYLTCLRGEGFRGLFLGGNLLCPEPPPPLSYYLDQGTSKNKFLRKTGLLSRHRIDINNKSTIAAIVLIQNINLTFLIWSLILKPSSFFLFNSNNFMRVIKHTESIFILIVSKIQINFTLKLISTIGF